MMQGVYEMKKLIYIRRIMLKQYDLGLGLVAPRNFVMRRIPCKKIIKTLLSVFLIFYVCGCVTQTKQLTSEVLYQDDFEDDLSKWVVEQMPGGSVRVRDGKLEIDDAKGCTVWFREKLEGDIMIEYEVVIIKKDGPHDRGSDLNCFWMAQDPKSYDNLFAGSLARGGRFSNYDSLRLYYVGYGANHNTTTRFRRYTGTGERPVLPEHDLIDEKYMLKYNVPIKIQLIADGEKVAYVRDSDVIYDVHDPDPYTDGWFGFRTVHNHMTIDNFKIYRLEK
jgi:hypothetical protein